MQSKKGLYQDDYLDKQLYDMQLRFAASEGVLAFEYSVDLVMQDRSENFIRVSKIK